jgi:hypothetical protein
LKPDWILGVRNFIQSGFSSLRIYAYKANTYPHSNLVYLQVVPAFIESQTRRIGIQSAPTMYLYRLSCQFDSFFFCGDIFAHEERIYQDYYLLEEEGRKDMSIGYKIPTGDFVGRVPSPVFAYSIVKDSFLIAKRQAGTETEVYILDLKRDNPYAHDSSYLHGILDETGFSAWKKKNNFEIGFQQVVNE